MGDSAIPRIDNGYIINQDGYNPPDQYSGFEAAYFNGHPKEYDEDNYCNIGLKVGEAQ